MRNKYQAQFLSSYAVKPSLTEQEIATLDEELTNLWEDTHSSTKEQLRAKILMIANLLRI